MKELLPADPLSIFPEPPPPPYLSDERDELRPSRGRGGGLVSPRSSSRLWHDHHGLAVHNLYSRVERRRNTLVNLKASVAGNVIFLTCTPPAAAASVGSPTAAACFFLKKNILFEIWLSAGGNISDKTVLQISADSHTMGQRAVL